MDDADNRLTTVQSKRSTVMVANQHALTSDCKLMCSWAQPKY